MSGINLHLDEYVNKKDSSKSKMMWIDVADMINTRFALDTISKKIVAIVSSDRKVCSAIETLRTAKTVIKTYGATESVMCVFNSGNTLADVIGMEIPVITSSNAKSVGRACCENIDATVVDAYAKVKEFFDKIVSSAGQYFTKLKVQASCQSATIDRLIGHITNVDKLDPVEYNTNDIFGYTQPVFMERANALQYISNNIGSLSSSNEEIKSLEPYLRVLGYKIVEKSGESLLEGDPAVPTQSEPTVIVEPETPLETEQTAPEPEEVLNPQPVVQGDPAEVISTEEPNTTEEPASAPVIQTTPAQVSEPADAPQTQSMAVFRWTPANIVVAAETIKNVLNSVPKFSKVCSSLSNVRGTINTAVSKLQSATENFDKITQEAIIDNGRSYAAFIGDVLAIYNNSINELVDQVISMAGKVVSAKSTKGVAPEAITLDDPMGISAKYENADPPAEPEKAEQPDKNNPSQKDEPEKAEPEKKEEPPKGESKPESNEPPASAPEGNKNEIETPENVPNDKPLSEPSKGVDPNAEAEPGKGEHIEPTETPEEEQTQKKSETFLGDVFGTRMW